MAGRGTKPRRIDLPQAVRSMRTLLADPENTAEVFVIIRALAGDAFERLYQRTIAAPGGCVALAPNGKLTDLLDDRERLNALPEGSLGRVYATFMAEENLSATGLVEASADELDEPIFLDPRAQELSRRLRDSHDLWHVLTGYGRDLLGEACLLAFSFAQTGNPGVGFIASVGSLRLRAAGHRDAVRLLYEGYRRGKRASLLSSVQWEVLLELPLDEVRRRLGIRPAQAYTPVFSQEAAKLHEAA